MEIEFAVEKETAEGFALHWRDVRRALDFGVDADLKPGVVQMGADGSQMVSYATQLLPHLTPIITAAFGYIVAKRGTIEIRGKEKTYVFKNINAQDARAFLELIRKFETDERE